MQIKREGGKNLPVHSCLRVPHYNRQISCAGQAKNSKWQHLYLLENRDRIKYPVYLYQQIKGERIKRKSILDVRTHLKNTKWKEIFQYEHFFTNSPLGVKNNLLRVTPRLHSFFFTRIYFIKILTLKPANFQNTRRINQRLRFSTRYNNLLI